MKKTNMTATILSSGANAIFLNSKVRSKLGFKIGSTVKLEILDGKLVVSSIFDPHKWAVNFLEGFVNSNGHKDYKVGRDMGSGITTVILPDGNVGVAECSPNDSWDGSVGEAIALARAMGRDFLIPDEIYQS